ncbi:hypothetical protein PAECIP111890_04937 [Paenibacillus sp. JJ-223]|nr:hypothetical protein PAECIP111890_04937 [Paenibacillus sp. JJ-223]
MALRQVVSSTNHASMDDLSCPTGDVNATKKLVASHEAVGYTVAMICRSSEKGKGGSCIEKWYFLWRLSAKPSFI